RSVIVWSVFYTAASCSKFWHISYQHLDPIMSKKTTPKSVFPPRAFLHWTRECLVISCDSPYHLIFSAFSYMKQADLQPEFIIWTGYKAISFTDLQLFCDVTWV
uniref:Uncharacterized protein n=1 Tax=Cyprinus carpio TaxID=7962 RepID=A0A8C1GG37_CYPCA